MCLAQKSKRVVQDSNFLGKLKALRKQGTIDAICFSGGEPTLNNRLFSILKEAKELFPDNELTLLSNGRFFFYQDFANKVTDVKDIKIAIPIHGHNEELHDSITRVKGSFMQTVQGINNLLDRDVYVELRVIINKRNYKFLDRISSYVFSNFAKIIHLVFIAMEMNSASLANGTVVTYNKFIPYLERAIEKTGEDGPKIKLFHFPLCVISRRYWDLIHKSIEGHKLAFSSGCNRCIYKTRCMGILKTYMRNIGTGEFIPIRRR